MILDELSLISVEDGRTVCRIATSHRHPRCRLPDPVVHIWFNVRVPSYSCHLPRQICQESPRLDPRGHPLLGPQLGGHVCTLSKTVSWDLQDFIGKNSKVSIEYLLLLFIQRNWLVCDLSSFYQTIQSWASILQSSNHNPASCFKSSNRNPAFCIKSSNRSSAL